jgi:hypothetical protein
VTVTTNAQKRHKRSAVEEEFGKLIAKEERAAKARAQKAASREKAPRAKTPEQMTDKLNRELAVQSSVQAFAQDK